MPANRIDEREDEFVTAKTAMKESLSILINRMLIDRWEQAAHKLATLAEEFPPDTYEFKPAEGVRTVGDVVRHVAFWNRYVAAAARGEAFDEAANEVPRAEY